MKAIGYVRVSTEEQALEGVSLEAQKERIGAWCKANDWELVRIYEDAGLSGMKGHNRPGFQEAISAACKIGATFIVYSLTRASRSTRETLELSERLQASKADLVSISERIDTTTASGKMVFRMLAVLGEFERDQIVERTKAALAHKKANGLRTGGIPYGKCLAPDGQTLLDNLEEQKIIRRVQRLRSKGASLREIQAELERKEIPNRNGSFTWRLNTLGKITKRKDIA